MSVGVFVTIYKKTVMNPLQNEGDVAVKANASCVMANTNAVNVAASQNLGPDDVSLRKKSNEIAGAIHMSNMMP